MAKNRSAFTLWFEEFELLAAKQCVPIGDAENYREYFEDGDAPDKALRMELKHMDRDIVTYQGHGDH